MLCRSERGTRITLYLDAMTYDISHVSYIYPLVHGNLHVTVNKLNLFKANLIEQNVTIKLYTMDNPSTSRDRFNSSNLSMPLRRLIYSSDHFASSLSKWLLTNDHESSPIVNKAAIARYPQLSSALTLTMFSIES